MASTTDRACAVDASTQVAPRPKRTASLRGRVGRYEILRPIGMGGMGTVYVAFDGTLERRVAIKVLARDRRGSAGYSRMRREAQAMAQLAHPNVATVYEVGRHEGQIFIAMEFVEGMSLAEWIADDLRPWSEVVDVFTQAGRGLYAAHVEGIVHRDFKPANAMMTDDGTVKVLDFGLARAAGEDSGSSASDEVSDPTLLESQQILATQLTETGTVVGTPAYMSPEQIQGHTVDARSDQFSFCVALYLGLYGHRPFLGSSYKELTAAILKGVPLPPPDRGVPNWVWKVVQRGLDPIPEQRWPSMAGLLEALQGPRSRRWVLPSVAAAAAVGIGATALWAGASPDPDACDQGNTRISEVWGDVHRTRVQSAVDATGVAYASSTWPRVSAQLDGYARGWAAAYDEACAAAREGDAQRQALDQRMRCLSERKTDLRTLVDVFESADENVIKRATYAVAKLRSVVTCRGQAPAAQWESDPQVIALRETLSAVRARTDAGDVDGAREAATSIVERARALGYPIVVVQALMEVGRLQRLEGEHEAAKQTLSESYWLADENGLHELAAASAGMLAYLVTDRLAQHDEAETWGRHALGKLERLGDGHDDASGSVWSAVGVVAGNQGRWDEAVDWHRKALRARIDGHGTDDVQVAAIRLNIANGLLALGKPHEALDELHRGLEVEAAALGEGHPDLGKTISNIASALSDLGRHEEALEQRQRVLKIMREALGPEHMFVGMSLANLGTTHERLAQYEQAGEHYSKAFEVFEKALGADHPHTATTRHNLGGILRLQGKYDEALEQLLAAQAVFVRVSGPDHPHIGASWITIGGVHVDRGDPDAALEAWQQAQRVYEGAFGAEHPDVALARYHIGDLLSDRGQHDEALGHLEYAVRVWKQTGAGEHREYALGLAGLGRALLRAGRSEAAAAQLEQALTLQEKGPADRLELATTQFALAQALETAQPDRALALAHDALGSVDGQTPPPAVALRTDVEAWLAAPR